MRLGRVLLGVCLVLSLFVAGAQAARSSEVLKILSVQVSQTSPSGTTFVIKDNDLIGGKKAGTDTLTCKTNSAKSSARCGVVFKLSAGTLTGTFTISFSSPKGVGKITSGTGKYAGKKGTLAFTNLNAKGTRTSVILTLS